MLGFVGNVLLMFVGANKPTGCNDCDLEDYAGSEYNTTDWFSNDNVAMGMAMNGSNATCYNNVIAMSKGQQKRLINALILFHAVS